MIDFREREMRKGVGLAAVMVAKRVRSRRRRRRVVRVMEGVGGKWLMLCI